jgi:hypothetical protein
MVTAKDDLSGAEKEWQHFVDRVSFMTLRQKEGLLRDLKFRAIYETSGKVENRREIFLKARSPILGKILYLAGQISPTEVGNVFIDLDAHLSKSADEGRTPILEAA